MILKKDKADVLGIKAAFFSFFFLVVFQITCNLCVVSPRSLPDEIGAIALGARMAGYDWTYVLTHPAYYYGSIEAPFLFPFFKIIREPRILYQCLIGVGVILRSLPAFICGRILTDFFKIDNFWNISGITICACLFTPTRGTNIDNEPALILIGWIIFYLLLDNFDFV